MRAAQKCLVRIDSNRITERLEIQNNNCHSCRRHSTHTPAHGAHGLRNNGNMKFSSIDCVTSPVESCSHICDSRLRGWFGGYHPSISATQRFFPFWLASHASQTGRQGGNEEMKRYSTEDNAKILQWHYPFGCVRLYIVYIYCIRSHGRRDMPLGMYLIRWLIICALQTKCWL